MESGVFVFICSKPTDFSPVGAWDKKVKGKQRKSLKGKTGNKAWKPYDFELRYQAVLAFPVCPVALQTF